MLSEEGAVGIQLGHVSEAPAPLWGEEGKDGTQGAPQQVAAPVAST